MDTKPGECPAVTSRTECPPSDDNVEGCLIDTDCAGDQKCCSDGCVLKCSAVELPPTPQIVKGEPGDPGEAGDPVSIYSYPPPPPMMFLIS